MVKKSVGIVAAALAFGVVGFAANGCSSSSSAGVVSSDAATGGDGNIVVHDSGTPADTGAPPPACYAASAVTFPWGPPTLNQNLCAAGEIQGFIDTCLDNAADAADAGGACVAYVVAHAGCVACIEGPLDAATVPDASTPTTYPAPAIFTGTNYTYLNSAGCIAAISTSGTDTTCTAAASNLQNCASLNCESCIATDDAAGDATTACETYADNDPTVCGASYAPTAACETAINAVSDTDVQTKCGISTTTTFEQGVLGIATAMCAAVP